MVSTGLLPFGIVEDLYPEETCPNADVEKAQRLLDAGDFTHSLDGDILTLRQGMNEVSLKVKLVLGGNQFNVYQNLKVLHELFPSVDVVVRAIPTEEVALQKIERQSLHLPGDKRYRLSMPKAQSLLDLNGAEGGGTFFISSAEAYCPQSPHWNWVRGRAEAGGKFYWNPTRSDLTGALPADLLESMSGNIEILQMNEEEAHSWLEHYGKFPSANWTVITLGDKGAVIVDSDGVQYDIPLVSLSKTAQIFGESLNPHPVGCGDAFLSALIFARESGLNLSVQEAGFFAGVISALQFHHKGSNLSSIKSLLLNREESSISEFGRIAA